MLESFSSSQSSVHIVDSLSFFSNNFPLSLSKKQRVQFEIAVVLAILYTNQIKH